MTAPVAVDPAEQTLLDLLGLVDASRERASALEDQYLADVAVLYAERLAAMQSSQETPENSQVLTAALLASLVLVIRRALTAGTEEGARFAFEQFDALSVPTSMLGEIEVAADSLGEKLVRDFLAGQVAVVKAGEPDLTKTFKELLRRANLAVVSAVQSGRGLATITAFEAVTDLLSVDLHKLWVARFDLDTPPCKLCVRLHGQHVPLAESFALAKGDPDPYVSPLNAPPRHPNCRCSLVLYIPRGQESKEGLTPLSMQSYAEWALAMSEEDRSEYLAATIVRVKGYSRMVDGRMQQVSGYFYNIQTGQKIPEGQWGSAASVKEVSAKQAKSMAKVSKVANKATPKGGALDLSWKPGTYKLVRAGDSSDVQVVVHQDGSSTSIYNGKTEDADKATTAQFLARYKQQGLVSKISDDPEVPDPDGPGPSLEPDEEGKSGATLAEGFYLLPENSNYGGVKVDADGTGTLYFPDFKQTLPLKQNAVKQIAKGFLGEFDEVEESEFTEDWYKKFKESGAGGAKTPKAAAPEGDAPAAAKQQSSLPAGIPGVSNSDTSQAAGAADAPDFKAIPDVDLPGEPPMPDMENAAAGVVVLEPDGSVWLYEPKGEYAGYKNTWPKGGVEEGYSVQQTAHKELWEETGITAEITGYLGDYKRSRKEGGKVRMYVAVRKGGTPLADDPTPFEEGGNETAAVKNVSPEEAMELLNVNRDKRVLKDLNKFGQAGRPPASASDSTAAQGAPDGPVSDAAPDEADPDAPARPASSPAPSAPAESAPAVPEAPEGGPGGVVAGGASLFSVGPHSVQVEEGSQVYKSGKSKDTLYVLKPDGDLIKYNPQGAGVQATKVGSSDNPAARAQQLAKLNNVSEDGVSLKDVEPAPGTGKALVGGFELTSGQLSQAIAALSANPSGNVAGDLKNAGSPLAAGKFHEVAAPYKAYYNNKTKPALIAALKKAQEKTGYTPSSEAPAVAHLAELHGLEDHQASLGHADTEAIHSALHAVDPEGSDHGHSNDGPGFISVDGVPFPPSTVASALEALKGSPTKETGVKKPLKASDSPLANLDLQGLANNSEITAQFKGSNGKVHYGKLKPAVIALLTDALDKHQSKNPPSTPQPAVIPDPVKTVGGVNATQAQILEMQQFFDGIDLDIESGNISTLIRAVSHNPLANGVDWDSLMESKAGKINIPDNELNKVLHDVLNDYLDVKTSYGTAPSPENVTPYEDVSPQLKVSGLQGTADQLKAYANSVDSTQSTATWKNLPSDNPFKDYHPSTILGLLGNAESGLSGPALKAALADAVQKKVDDTLAKENGKKPAASAPSSLSIGGQQISKADVLAAIEAVKSSPSTGVKGPLKAIDSPLSKIDIKAYIESDPASAPFKGGNGLVHYGKLKQAVAAVLQAKVDAMGVEDLPETPAITRAEGESPDAGAPDVAAPEQDAPEDDFFDSTSVTSVSGELSAYDKVNAAWKAAKANTYLGSNQFAVAMQEASVGTIQYTDGKDVSTDPDDFDGGDYYEVDYDEGVSKFSEDGEPTPVSDIELLSKLNGAFDAAFAQDDSLPDPGFYTGNGMSLKVYADGSALLKNISSGETTEIDSPSQVKVLMSGWNATKISDLPDELSKAYVDGVEVGKYSLGNGVSITVFPNGSVFVDSGFSESMTDVKAVKPLLQNQSMSPSALETDPPEWMKSAKKGSGGLLQGTYDLGGESLTVSEYDIKDEDGFSLTSDYVAALITNGDAHFMVSSAVMPEGVPGPSGQIAETVDPDQPQLDALVAVAKEADYQEPWASTTTDFSVAFQTAVKTNKTMYGNPNSLGDGKLSISIFPFDSNQYKFTSDGKVTFQSADGSVVLKTFSPAELVAKLDGTFNGPPATSPDLPEPPAGASEISPDGAWNGYSLGTYTNGEGEFITIGPDGPDLTDEDIAAGADIENVLDMLDSGDLSFVPPLESPVSSTPNLPPDAVKLPTFMVAGYTKLHWLDKPQLYSAVESYAKAAGFEGKAGLHLKSAKKEEQIEWLKYWSKGEWDKAYAIEAAKVKNHKAKTSHPGSPDNPLNSGGFQKKTMAPLIDGELPAGTVPPGVWPPGAVLYNDQWDPETVDAYLTAANMQNTTGLSAWHKKQWVAAHSSGDNIATDSLSYLGQKNVGEGDIFSEPILPPVEKVLPGQAVPLPPDFPEIDVSKAKASNLTSKQTNEYINHLAPSATVSFLSKQDLETKQGIVALHAASVPGAGDSPFKDPAVAKQELTDLLAAAATSASWNEEAITTQIRDLLKVKDKTFTMDALQPPLAGHSTLYHVTDENGNPFLFKVAPEDFRAEIEDAAHQLASLAGLNVAQSQLGKFNGKFGQFQAKIPSKSTLKGVNPADLPLSALKDLLDAHVQDYATSNDDAHDDNFLLSPDGKRVIPIDIARAYVRFGQPGAVTLELGSLSSWETPYYQGVYDAILSKKFSDADVDELYRESLSQARRTQGVDDAAWSSVMAAGLKNRTNFGMTSAKNSEQLIKQALARKNGLVDEFDNFWDGIYSKLGREKPKANAPISKWVYSGVSPEHLAQVEKTGHSGTSTFFGGTSLEDGYLLTQVFQGGSGSKELHFSGQLRKEADKAISKWMKDRTTVNLTTSNVTSEQSKVNKIILDVGASKYADYILAAGKTVSHHNSKGDQNFNTGHMANFESMQADVTVKLSAANAGNFPSVLTSDELKQEYKNLLEYYNGRLTFIQNLKDMGGQSNVGDLNAYKFKLPKESVVDPPVTAGFTVKKINSYYDQATIDSDGNYELTGYKDKTGQRGSTYQLTLADGTEIEYRPWDPSDGGVLSQQGGLKIKVRDYDGTTSGADAALKVLGDMGVSFDAATEEDMELLYYRHLYGASTDRNDVGQGKLAEVVKDVEANLPGGANGTPALSAKEELERWRAAWSRLDPDKFNTFLSGKAWLPKFGRADVGDASLRGGQPYWNRFDVTAEDYNSKEMPTHALSDPGVVLNIVKAGGLYSTDDRPKMIGQWYEGQSSHSDQIYGSAAFVFTRINGVNSNFAQVHINPAVLARTSTYAFSGDKYGEIALRKSMSAFDFKNATKHTGHGNETMIKHSLSFYDDIDLLVFSNPAVLKDALDFLQSRGVTMIRGLPITDRLVLQSGAEAARAKVKKHAKTWVEED